MNLFRSKKSFENLIPTANEESLDLLRRLLHFNPDKRITAEEGLRHPFVHSYVENFLSVFFYFNPFFLFFDIRFHNPSEEIIKGYDVVPQLSDDIQLTVDEYRKKLYEVKIYLY